VDVMTKIQILLTSDSVLLQLITIQIIEYKNGITHNAQKMPTFLSTGDVFVVDDIFDI